MSDVLKTMLRHAKRRTKSGRSRAGNGVGLAWEYVKTYGEFLSANSGRTPDYYAASQKIDSAAKAAKNTLVFRQDGMDITKQFTSAVTVGEGKDAKTLAPTAGAVADYVTVLTTARKDRDGDILLPAGAIIDPKSPVLYQHVPFEPCGKLVQVLSQNDKLIEVHCAIIDNLLGNDVAKLAEFGCLRTSHGFRPLKAAPREDDPDDTDFTRGWLVESYEVMEASLVSVPSNKDAELTLFSRDKLHHPVVKSIAEWNFRSRPAVVKGGWAAPVINVTINNAKGADMAATKDGNTDVKVGTDAQGKDAVGKDAKVPPTRKDGESADRPSSSADDDPKNEPKEKPDQPENEGDKKQSVMMKDIADAVAAAAKDKSLPQEAKDRYTVVTGMLSTIQANLDAGVKALMDAAKSQDLAGMCGAMADIIKGVCLKLGDLKAEIDKIAAIADMPEGCVSAAADIASQVDVVTTAISEAVSQSQPAQTTQDTTNGQPTQTPAEAGKDASEEGGEENPEQGQSAAADQVVTKCLGVLWAGDAVDVTLLETLADAAATAHADAVLSSIS